MRFFWQSAPACWLAIGLAAISAGGCRQDSPFQTADPEVEAQAKTPLQLPAGLGALEGHIRLGGDRLPRATVVRNTTDPEACGPEHVLEDYVVDEKSRGMAHVIVALSGVPREQIPAFEPGRLLLDNRECRFVPPVSVLTVGSTLESLNSDPVPHTVHLYGAVQMNLSLPFQGMRATRSLERPGMVAVKCDLHGWMQAFIRVDEHPFHDVTDRTGAFRIAGVPPGEYTLEVWHQRLGWKRLPVEIESSRITSAEIEYTVNPD